MNNSEKLCVKFSSTVFHSGGTEFLRVINKSLIAIEIASFVL